MGPPGAPAEGQMIEVRQVISSEDFNEETLERETRVKEQLAKQGR